MPQGPQNLATQLSPAHDTSAASHLSLVAETHEEEVSEAQVDPEPAPQAPPPLPAASLEAESREAQSSPEEGVEAESMRESEEAQEPPATPVEAPESFGQDLWEDFVERVRKDDTILAASLDHIQVLSYSAHTLRVGSGRSTHTIESVQAERSKILSLLRAHMGPLSGFEVEMVEKPQDTPFERREVRRIAALKARREALANHPAVGALVERFGAKLMRVELEGEEE